MHIHAGIKTTKKSLTIKWSKVKSASGYEIQVATDKYFKKNKKSILVKKQKTTSAKIKKLKSKKKYYVRGNLNFIATCTFYFAPFNGKRFLRSLDFINLCSSRLL